MKWSIRVTVGLLTLVPAVAWSTGSQKPVAVSPGAGSAFEQVADQCASFSWAGSAEAIDFTLVVYEVTPNGQLGHTVVRRRLPAGASSWTLPAGKCLARGETYAWTVGETGKQASTIWSEPVLFGVASEPTAAELQEALAVVRSYLATQDPATGPGVRVGGNAGAWLSASLAGSAEQPSPHAVAPTALSVDGGVEAASFSGDGTALINLDPANLAAGTAAIDISGTAAIASNLVGGASVSEAELEFDPATQTEMDSHASNSDSHREHATLEESAEIDTDIATHAGLANVHHTPTVDTDTVLSEAQVEGYVTDDPLDMGNNAITNIGASGTDFTATGGLTVSDDVRFNADLGIGTDPLPGTERNIYMYDGGIYSDPQLYISGHNSGLIQLERRRTDGGTYTLRSGCGSVNCGNDFSIARSGTGTCIAIRDGCDVDIPILETDAFMLNPTDSPVTCSSSTEGALYFDDSLGELCSCNGSAWNQVDGGGIC